MENVEEVFNFLEEFTKRKPKTIPQELNDYLAYVARTGDPVYQWSLVKCLFKEKLLTVITDFYETTPGIEIPPYPNVDPFNYDIMKNSLLERLDSFTSAPFTVQRICELLTYPRKQYNRIDKFMRAVEKNILVVSTREPGAQRHPEPDNGEVMEPVVNGSDNNSDYNVDVEMEDMSWKENSDVPQNAEPQPSSSDAHISVDDLETRLQTEVSVDAQEKFTTRPEAENCKDSTTEENVDNKEVLKNSESIIEMTGSINKSKDIENSTPPPLDVDTEMKMEETAISSNTIPDIKIDDAEMTEQRLKEESKEEIVEQDLKTEIAESNIQPISSDESSSDSNCKEETEVKHISEVSTSSEESSSSSDNNESNSNSPKDEVISNVEELPKSDKKEDEISSENEKSDIEQTETIKKTENISSDKIQSDNYSISDVNSQLSQPSVVDSSKTNEVGVTSETEEVDSKTEENVEEIDKTETSS